jgi:DNA-binding MarR family transcriptional regulator
MKKKVSEDQLLLLIKQLDLTLEAEMNRIMGKKDLSGSQAAILCYLLRHHPEGSCIRELCTELGVTHATLSLMIKKMQRQGYLAVRSDETDRRKKRVTVTDRLDREDQAFLERSDQAETLLFRALDSGEKQELYRLQKKLLQSIRHIRNP